MKQKNFILPVALLLSAIILSETGIANAADNNSAVNEIANGLSGLGSGFGYTFQTQVSNLSKSLLASAKIIAVIMTAAGRDSVAWFVSAYRTARKLFGTGYWESGLR